MTRGVLVLALVLGGAAALAIVLFALSTGLTRGAPERPRDLWPSAESGLNAALAIARTEGAARIRAAARGEGPWPDEIAGLARRVTVARPVRVGVVRPEGTELSRRDGVELVSEVYRVEAAAGAGTAFELEAELVMPVSLAPARARPGAPR